MGDAIGDTTNFPQPGGVAAGGAHGLAVVTGSRHQEVQELLRERPRRWQITGVAGLIGSHLLEALLKLDQAVVGLDNYATGHARNQDAVTAAAAARALTNSPL